MEEKLDAIVKYLAFIAGNLEKFNHKMDELIVLAKGE